MVKMFPVSSSLSENPRRNEATPALYNAVKISTPPHNHPTLCHRTDLVVGRNAIMVRDHLFELRHGCAVPHLQVASGKSEVRKLRLLPTRQTMELGGAGGRHKRRCGAHAGSFPTLLPCVLPTGDSSILPMLYCPGSPAGCWSSTDTI